MKKDGRLSRTLIQREPNRIQYESLMILPQPKTGILRFISHEFSKLEM
jgi:hypothetical protein